MSVTKHIRLRNVSEVRFVPRADIVGGTNLGLGLRPDTVEISRDDAVVKVAMYQRFDHSTGIFWDEPVLIGVLEVPADGIEIVDAANNDFIAWEVVAHDQDQPPKWRLIIRPFADETIDVDCPTAPKNLDAETEKLYADLRDLRDSLVVNRRTRARKSGRAADLSDRMAAMFRADIAQLEKEIAARQAKGADRE